MKKLFAWMLVLVLCIGLFPMEAHAYTWRDMVGTWELQNFVVRGTTFAASKLGDDVTFVVHGDGTAVLRTGDEMIGGKLEQRYGWIGDEYTYGVFMYQTDGHYGGLWLDNQGRIHYELYVPGAEETFELRLRPASAILAPYSIQKLAGTWYVKKAEPLYYGGYVPTQASKMTMTIYKDGYALIDGGETLGAGRLEVQAGRIAFCDSVGSDDNVLNSDGTITLRMKFRDWDIKVTFQDTKPEATPKVTATPKATATATPKPTSTPQLTDKTVPQQGVCETCDGKGQVHNNCTNCGGDGKESVDCSFCHGGNVNCSTCDGSKKESCSTCKGTGRKKCTICGGDGKAGSKACGHCDGTGKSKCTNCSGKGNKNCTKCHGSGKEDCRNCNNGWRNATCSKCSGKGYSSSTCWKCKGNGTIETATPTAKPTATPMVKSTATSSPMATARPTATPTPEQAVCDTCEGEGTMKSRCLHCDGRGVAFSECPACAGGAACGSCYSGRIVVDCSQCNAKGYVTETCWSCNGAGIRGLAGQDAPQENGVTTEPKTSSSAGEELANAVVGDYITFGAYEQDNDMSNGKEPIEWLVLAKENGRLLVVSRYALDSQPYHSSFNGTPWKTCTLRTWLNKDFFNAAFGSAEQARISVVTVSADTAYPGANTDSGAETPDKVFLLSNAEANQYFATNGARKCQVTPYAKIQGARTQNGLWCCWWLRIDRDQRRSADCVNYGGDINYPGYRVTSEGCSIRPAIWIELDP